MSYWVSYVTYVVSIIDIVTGHSRYSNIFGDSVREFEYRITESWANRQIFAVPNHRITEYRILANLSNIRSIEYRITESIRWPNIEPRFDDSIFGHRISNTSNHRIFDDSVSLFVTLILGANISIHIFIFLTWLTCDLSDMWRVWNVTWVTCNVDYQRKSGHNNTTTLLQFIQIFIYVARTHVPDA